MPTKRPRNEKHVAAVELLQHYFRIFAEKSGVSWSEDNDEEVGHIVDLIVDAARADDD